MTMLAHNIKIIICHTLILGGGLCFFLDFLKTLKRSKFKIIGTVIGTVFISVILMSMFLSIVYKEFESTGVVTDIVTTGSWTGLMDIYTVDIKLISGKDIRVSTSLFSPRKLKDALKNVNVGDEIFFSYGGYFDVIYNLTVA